MDIINVRIKNKNFKVFVITYQGYKVNVAEPRLETEIIDSIEHDGFFNNCASIEGKPCNVEDVSDLYYYVFGDVNNINPTEDDIINSISTIWEGAL